MNSETITAPQQTSKPADGESALNVGLAAAEGWTWHQGGRKWHYYRGHKALCGGMMMLVHPSEGYELGNTDSKDNCAACRRKKQAEAANVKLTRPPIIERKKGDEL
jgi:hypothetical protein